MTFREIYDQHFDFVWRSLRAMGVDRPLIDDVVQDVFFVAFRKSARFEGRSSMRTWLFGIAMREARMVRRAQRRRGHHEPIKEEAIVDRGPDPGQSAEAAEALRRLWQILDQLPEDQRTVFVLAEMQELSVPEIAELVEAKLNTVYSRLRLARDAVNAALTRWRGGAP
jgi:RNA polymerase sigma-70 factor, ECF subfamily